MQIRPIRTEDQYHTYLEEVERLTAGQQKLSRQQADHVEVLTVLIEAYENSKYPIDPLDPVEAILFRMEEKGLKQADLVPYFGTSSRVSEVLNRKRPLTVQMIRAVALGLGISAETLIGLGDVPTREKKPIVWSKFPIKEMMNRGWLNTKTTTTSAEELVQAYIAESDLQFGAASFRRTLSGEAQSPMTQYALYAWLARVIQKSRSSDKPQPQFVRDKLSFSFLRELAQLSWSERGPLLAIEFLEQSGIHVVLEPHLKGTQLDGAALCDTDGRPIVALTLRFDRLDNFWFTLLHEVVHIWKHVTNDQEAFVDDLNHSSEDRREAEANRLAREAFIPRLVWRRSDAYLSPNRENILYLAKELRIHPAIVVGRLHKETGNYTVFNDMVGHHQVRDMLLSNAT